MKRRPAIPALLALALALAGVAVSQAQTVPMGNVVVKFNANFDPHQLPRRRPAPVRIEIKGSVSTTDGSHPPPLQQLEVELNRNGQLATVGLPVCSAPRLQSTTTDEALDRCRPAVVGHGEFQAVVALGEDIPTGGRIVAFNSRVHGRPALLLHLFARVPARFTLVVPLTIDHRNTGEFGTVLHTRVPKIAGGLGSVTEIDLTIGRRYGFGGRQRSYVSAACRAPAGFNIVPFVFARATFHFESHRKATSKRTRSCRVR